MSGMEHRSISDEFELRVLHYLQLYGAVSLFRELCRYGGVTLFFDSTVKLCRSNTIHVGIRRSYLHCFLATFISIGYRIHAFNMDLLSTLLHSTQFLWATGPATSQVILETLETLFLFSASDCLLEPELLSAPKMGGRCRYLPTQEYVRSLASFISPT